MNVTRKMRAAAIAALGFALGLGGVLNAAPGENQAASGGVKVPKLEFHDVKLDNGLRVILVPDHSAPVYGIDVCYNVGARNEHPGRTGFAHLFEHMMFEGSENVAKGEHFVLVFNNGGNMNGTTNEDRTTYFEELPKNQLDLGLFLEADRMRALNVTQANLDNQRNAVQEERRQGIDNQPYGRAQLDLDNLAYDNFAYKHSTIGSMTDLNAASIDDVKDFFRIYYAPNNAVLTLVGDFDPEEALAKVKKYFGAIPAQPAPPKVDLSEEPHYGERREVIYDPLARLPEIDMAYHIPAGNTPENYAAQQLTYVLGQGESSRFYQRPGVKVEDLEKAIDEEIATVAKSGVTPEELAKAKSQLLRQFIERRRSALFTALLIGNYTVYFNDPNLINTRLDKIQSVGKQDLERVAKTYLTQENRTVVTTLPKPKTEASLGTPVNPAQ